MITSKSDYAQYLEADRVALKRKPSWKGLLFDEIWQYQRLMRKLEYLTNCKRNKILRVFTHYRYRKLGIKLGFSIPINTFGPGLSIAHYGTIVVNGGAKIGANCRIHVDVNIGTEAGKQADAPTIGNDCYIGPGAKIFGKIILGDDIAIGANAVVNKSFPEGPATLGGVPARVISNKGAIGLH